MSIGAASSAVASCTPARNTGSRQRGASSGREVVSVGGRASYGTLPHKSRASLRDANANIGISIPPITPERSPGPEAGGIGRPLHPQSYDPRRTPALAHRLAVDAIL